MATSGSSGFGEMLKRCRLAAGLSQEELAERAGLSARGISDLERGIRRAPQRETIRLLADALRLSTEERTQLTESVERRRGPTLGPSSTSVGRSAPTAELPVPSTRLVGREREASEVRELLLEPDTHLVTLTGPGGVGKTRLALRVAEDLRSSFSDGVHFVRLSTIGDPALLPSALAHAFGVAETSGYGPEDALEVHLRDAELCLVLDNFEHLVDGAPLVARLLAASPGLKVLVTSRALLRLSGEYEYMVPPLEVPGGGREVDARQIAASDAVSLFVQRARTARPTFGLTTSNAPAVAAICRRLDGLPLAIELAAARIRVLPPEAMLGRIDRSLALLTGGARDLPERQKTLRAAIDWSYDLLDENEKALFARLAVFSGGWTLEAAEDICNPEGEFDLVEGIESLVEKSLVGLTGSQGAEPRFGMLATIREYGSGQLEATGGGETVRRRHAEYYVTLAQRSEPELRGSNQAAWLGRLEQEHDNLRVALAWLLGCGEAEAALRLATSVWRFWDMRGHYSEGRLWLERGLSADPSVSARVRARALNASGYLAWMQGDYRIAELDLERSLELKRVLGDAAETATTLNNLGLVALDLGDFGRAGDLLRESLTLRRREGDAFGTALSLNNLGYTAVLSGDYATAASNAEESLRLFRELGNSWGTTLALTNLGRASLGLEDLRRACSTLVESLRLSEALGERRNIAECLEGLAAMALQRGDAECGAQLYGAAGSLRAVIGSPISPAERTHHRLRLDTLRQRLGGDRFDVLTGEGRAMGLANAIAMATDMALP